MNEKWLLTLRDLLWELIVAHEKGEIQLNEVWLKTIVATHDNIEEYTNNIEDT